MVFVEGLIVLVTLIYLLYRYGTATYEHWAQRGVRFLKPYPFVGTSYGLISGGMNGADLMNQYYKDLEGSRFGGVFAFRQPILIIRDPELIKQVTVKDFDHFTNRNAIVSEEADPLFGKNLLSISDQKWRDMRNTLSPTFTASKMKAMFDLVDNCGQQLVAHISGIIKNQVSSGHSDGEVYKTEMKALFSKFTNDVIATTAFGIQVDSLKDPENDFYRMGSRITKFQGFVMLKFVLYMTVPKLMKFLRIRLFGTEASEFFTELIHGAMRTREEQHIVRPDMIQLLMQAKKGTLTDDGGAKPKKTELTDDDITAQALLFFFAGFDTSSTNLGFTAYELATNKAVQTRLQEEIDQVLEATNGRVTYDVIMHKMPYLDMVLDESLRLWPPGFVIDRKVSKRYVIPKEGEDPEVVLERGDVIWVTVFGLHRDPKYFPDPTRFDPERFSEENKKNIPPFTYLPFGSGPRNCVGMRFALMEVKVCLVHLLKNFTFEVTDKTDIPLTLNPKNQAQLMPKDGFCLGLKPRV